jgi:ABC-type dipeptide/oligopeptide/nickel transport system permease subunit
MASKSGVIDLRQIEDEQYISQSLWSKALVRLRRDRLTLIALGLVAFLAAASFLAPPILTSLFGLSSTSIEAESFLPVGAPGHILGTDDLGRDHLIRLMLAGRVSLSIGFLAASLSLIIGVTLGLITGFYGGIVDDIITWLITTINSIPFFFIILIIAAILSPGPETLILVLGLLGWTGTTRLVRGETLSTREREYVLSARAVGASSFRIMFQHIMPNLISIILINLAIDIGVLILVEAGLSFLGVGVKPPTPTWGNMLTNAQTFFTRGPHLVFWPGLMIFLTVLSLYVIGDGLRDALDPTAVDKS